MAHGVRADHRRRWPGIVHDVGLAEELAQDTLVIALEQWPIAGMPDHPGSWLMATAKHRAIDLLRRQDPVPGETRTRSAETTPEAEEPDVGRGAWTTTSATTCCG